MYKKKFFFELHRGEIFAAINVFYNIPDIYIKTDVVIDDFGKCLDAATKLEEVRKEISLYV